MITSKHQCLGLDISTSVVGFCGLAGEDIWEVEEDGELLVEQGRLETLDAIKLTGTKLENLWQKADYVSDWFFNWKAKNPDVVITKIFVEENAKRFAEGFTSADVILTLAKFNGIVSYLAHKTFDAEVFNINVTKARSAIGFKNKLDGAIDPLTKKKMTVKEKVFNHVIALHPEFPWKKHVAKSGSHKGNEVFDDCSRDMCDAYVVCKGGISIIT